MSAKQFFLLIAMIVACTLTGAAQSPMLIDQLLEADPAPLSLSAELLVFVATQTGAIPDPAGSPPFETARVTGLFPPEATDPAAPTTMAVASLALVEAFSLHSGILYPIQRNPRRAMRELDYRGILPKGSTGDTRLSGESLLRLVSAVIAWEQTYGAIPE